MKNFYRPFLAFLIVINLLAISPSARGGDGVLAVVNGEKLTASDYRRFLLKIDPAMTGDTVDGRLLNKAIEEKIIVQEASKRGIKVSGAEVERSIKEFLEENHVSEADFEKRIKERGMSTEEYRKWLREDIIVIAKIIDIDVDGKVVVDDNEMRAYYESNRQQYRKGPETMRVKAIFMKVGSNASPAEVTYVKLKAIKILSELEKGEAFDRLAGLYSEDPSKKYDGTFGEFKKGDLVPALDRRLSEMKEGETSGPVWTMEGVYILKLVKRQNGEFVPFETVKDDIRNLLVKKERDQRYAEWVKVLWEKSVIEIKSH